jgi:hypothetical protein
MYSTSDMVNEMVELWMGQRGPTMEKKKKKKKTRSRSTSYSTDELVYHDAHRLLIPLMYERGKYGNTKARNTCDIVDY